MTNGTNSVIKNFVNAYLSSDETVSFLVQTWLEIKRARAKFPGDNVTMLALIEEVGELSKAAMFESPLQVYAEAMHVACMATRMATEGDCTIVEWRNSQGLQQLPYKAMS